MNAATQVGFENLAEPICEALAPNLETLIRAARNGDLALLECRLKSTGETVAAIVAVNRKQDGYEFVPIGVMLCGNPYEMLEPPKPEGGFEEEAVCR